jgi:putative nucleotidyltransferase with HDIG domain
LRARPDPAVDAELRQLLGSEAQWRLLARLAPFDRAHHLCVYHTLFAAGQRDPDLLRAALLHDVGKADEHGHVRAVHRAASVVLRRLAPAALRWLTARDRRGPLHGLYLARQHAALGAALARAAGVSERCCALIAHHEDEQALDDPALAALVAADEATIA